SGSVAFSNIERVTGSSFDDRLTANDGVQGISNSFLIGPSLSGGPGNDTLIGGALGDVLSGGEGNDEIHAGAGDDNINLIVAAGATYGNDIIDGESGFDALFVESLNA